jgi:AraC-like DNA-binding protein
LQEADALRDRLKLSSVDASVAFHREYHRRPRRKNCQGSALETAFRTWSEYDDDPRETFRSWAVSFLSAFDLTHPSSGAERAAMILRSRFQGPFRLDALAAEVGMSRSALTRAFRDAYGLTCGEYMTRARLRWFVEHVRMPVSSTEQLALDVGYANYHNLSDALMRRTGYRPSTLRRLNEREIAEVLRKRLTLSES